MSSKSLLPECGLARHSVAQDLAQHIRAYVQRRKSQPSRCEVTVRDVCRRFRLRQADAIYCIEHGGAGLLVSDFSYGLPADVADSPGGFVHALSARFDPMLDPSSPVGRRIVVIVDSGQEE